MSCVFVVGIKVLKDSDIEGRPMLGVGLNDAKAAAHATNETTASKRFQKPLCPVFGETSLLNSNSAYVSKLNLFLTFF